MNALLRRGWMRISALIALTACALLSSGCNIVAPIGAIAENIRYESSTTYDAEYDGLKGKSFAVVVTAERSTQAEHMEVVARLAERIAERLKDNTAATGYIPGARVLQYQFDHPRWVSWTYGELGRKLGVDRVVVVELTEYRLLDPGNRYLWKGVARTKVGVVEVDGSTPDDFAFQRELTQRYPDKDGYGPGDMDAAQVTTLLSNRVIDRVSWLFYEHETPNKQKW